MWAVWLQEATSDKQTERCVWMDHVLKDRWVAKAKWRSDDTTTVSTDESESRACTADPGGLVKEANKEKTASGVESWSSAFSAVFWDASQEAYSDTWELQSGFNLEQTVDFLM